MRTDARARAPLAARLLALAVLLVGPSARAGEADLPEIEIAADDTAVTTSVRVRPGTYRVRDAAGDGVLRVAHDGVTVDLTGVTLIGAEEGATPDAFEGVGVSLRGARGVTVRGGTIRGFRVNLRAERCADLRLEGIDAGGARAMRLRSTPAREDPADWLWPHENDAGQWEARYGAGLSLSDCAGARVEGCRANRAQNGLLLTRCDDARVEGNDFSWNSGWGIALWRSGRAWVAWNRCDWCVRGYRHGVYARGQDSAGILVFEQCSDGTYWRNSATHSGDGFFLYAGHETTQRTGKGGSNRNLLAGNDFSFAVANGIEATFSEGNEFVGNDLDECDHGVWGGYSRGTRIEGNRMRACANGVSVEHGTGNVIRHNEIQDCGVGVHLWWDEDADLLASAFGRANDVTSGFHRVEANRFWFGGRAVRLVEDHDSIVRSNEFRDVGTVLEAKGDVRNLFFRHNRVVGTYRVRGATTGPLRIGRDARDAEIEGTPAGWTLDRAEAEPAPAPWLRHDADRDAAPWVPRGMLGRGRVRFDVPPVRDTPRPDTGARPRGRAWILVDEWGPVDPLVPRVFPAVATGAGAATLHVLGPRAEFEVVATTPGVVVEPREGTAPRTVTVRADPASDGGSLTAFALRVRIGTEEHAATGTLFATTWDVAWWPWTVDPREGREAFATLVAGAPAVRRSLPSLDWAGSGAPVEGVPPDRFATVATTTLKVPAGRYRFRVVSDDGVRLAVDGETLLEDWTWHGPKEDVVVKDLAAGTHDVRVEHFEIDGYATLRCVVESVAPE